MKELEKFPNIPIKKVQTLGVQALSDRPNTFDRYGKGGLSAQQLKLWFDELATMLVNHANNVNEIWAGESPIDGSSPTAYKEPTKYVKLPNTFKNKDFVSLYDLLVGIVSNAFAHELIVNLTTYPEKNSAPNSRGIWKYPLDVALNKTLELIKSDGESNKAEFNRLWAELAHSIFARKEYGSTSSPTSFANPRFDFLLKNRQGDTISKVELPLDIRSADIPDGILTERMYEDESITTNKIRKLAVDTDKLKNEAVDLTKLKNDIVALLNTLRTEAFINAVYDEKNGDVIFTSASGSQETLKLPLELIVTGGSYSEETESIVLVLANGTEISISLGDLISGITADIEDVYSKIKNEVICSTESATAIKEISWSLKELTKGDIILVKFAQGNENTSPVLRITSKAGAKDYKIYRNGDLSGTADSKLKMPVGYVAYFRVEGTSIMMLNPITGGSNINDDGTFVDQTWSSAKTAEELARPEHSTMIVTISKEGAGGYKADYTSSQIINHAQTGTVIAKYVDDKSGETRTYQYTKQTSDRRAVFSKDGYVENGISKQTLIYVDYAGNIEVETREPKNPMDSILTVKVSEAIPEITDISSFRTYFYNLRKSDFRHYQFEISKDEISYSLMQILGYPEGVADTTRLFLYVDLPYSEAGGFEIDLTLMGRNSSEYFKRVMHATINSGWQDSGWRDANSKVVQELGNSETDVISQKVVSESIKKTNDIKKILNTFDYNFKQSWNPNAFYADRISSGVHIVNNYDGSVSFNGTCTEYTPKSWAGDAVELVIGHKYFIAINSNNRDKLFDLGFNTDDEVMVSNYHTLGCQVFTAISKCDHILKTIYRDENYNGFTISPICVDLTEVFGVGNEPNTAEEVYRIFEKNKYYPYGDNIILKSDGYIHNINDINKTVSTFGNKFKQIWNPNAFYGDSTSYGVHITNNYDGSVSFEGIGSDWSGESWAGDGFPLTSGHKYFVAINSNNSDTGFALGIGSQVKIFNRDTISAKIFTATGEPFHITKYIYKDTDYTGFVIKPICIDLTDVFGEGNEPRTLDKIYSYIVKNKYYPFGDNIMLDAYKMAKDAGQTADNLVDGFRYKIKQIFNPDSYTSITTYGITITNNHDGSVSIDGTATENLSESWAGDGFPLVTGHKYFMSLVKNKDLYFRCGLQFDNPYKCYNADESGCVFTAPSIPAHVIKSVRRNVNYDGFVFKPMLIDLTATFGDGGEPNEPYQVFEYIEKGKYYDLYKTYACTYGLKCFENNIAPYYGQHLMDKEAVINEQNEKSLDSDSFIFFTDYHYELNAGNIVPLFQHIMDNTGVRCIWYGGDTISGTYPYDFAKTQILRFRNMFNQIEDDRIFFTIGNHEFSDSDCTHADTRLTYAQVYDMVNKSHEATIHRGYGTSSYFVDNPSQKIRYYCLSCDCFAEQSKADYHFLWGNIEKDLKNDWSVFVIIHGAVATGNVIISSQQELADGLDALKLQTTHSYDGTTYDFTNKRNTVIGVLCGHYHEDLQTATTEGIPFVATTCDSYGYATDGYARAKGEISEHAFEVVTINQTEKKIYFTRIGAGHDRVVTY